jgi:fructosamine-3-kinase
VTGGDDISWKALGRIVREWAGDPAELTEVVPLAGGSVNNTLLLVTGDHRKAVLKITPHRVDRELVNEAHQLNLLRDYGFPVPELYLQHPGSLDNPNTYILIEFVEGITLAAAKKQLPESDYDSLQHQLAELVLRLHDHTRDTYGKVDISGNHQATDWPAFYRSLHDHSVHAVEQVTEIPIKMRRKIEKLHTRLDQYLAHSDQPRLCHGDLWGKNVMVNQDDSGAWKIKALLDPNLRYGHCECELAYLDLFDTSTKTFRRDYQAGHKLQDDYHKIRKPIYQLYPLMDNVQAFGQRYVAPLMQVAERACAVV